MVRDPAQCRQSTQERKDKNQCIGIFNTNKTDDTLWRQIVKCQRKPDKKENRDKARRIGSKFFRHTKGAVQDAYGLRRGKIISWLFYTIRTNVACTCPSVLASPTIMTWSPT